MAINRSNGNGRRQDGGANGAGPDGATAQADMEQEQRRREAAANDIPPDDGAMDGKSMLSKLSLGMMGVQPEQSKKRDQTVTLNGITQVVKVGENVLQALLFGHITGLTGPKELPNAKTEADKYTRGLVGVIEGINVQSGEMFKAGVLYLPGGFHDLFLSEMEAALAGGDANTMIAFSLEFWSVPADNPAGYSWKAVNKMPIAKSDPLAGLRARALKGVTVKALPAPTA